MTGGVRRRPRDPLPLPVPPVPERPKRGLGRGCAQRCSRRNAIASAVATTTKALNALCVGQSGQPLEPSSGLLSATQQLFLEHIEKSVDELGPPPEGLSPAAALTELRGPGQYLVGPVAASAPYVEGSLSLPAVGTEPVALAVLWGEGGDDRVGRFLANALLPASVSADRVSQSSLHTPYWDPKLLSRKRYDTFINNLSSRGLIEFRRSIHEQVGVFLCSEEIRKIEAYHRRTPGKFALLRSRVLWGLHGGWFIIYRGRGRFGLTRGSC